MRFGFFGMLLLAFLANSCHKSKNKPLITTVSVIQQGGPDAKATALVYEEGDAPLDDRGFCWSLKNQPTTKDSFVKSGDSQSTYTAILQNLTANTIYYVRAFATNKFGTTYGNEIILVTKTGAPAPVFNAAKILETDEHLFLASATLQVSAGMAPLIECGICWSLANNVPTADSSHATSSANIFGQYSVSATALSGSTDYAVRAYATNSTGTSYSNVLRLKTNAPGMSDIENNKYKTIKIGTQVWMAENLRTTTFNDGTPITYLSTRDAWINNNNASAGYCYYNEDLLKKNKYGIIYNSRVINTSRSIAPQGWRVPTTKDWQTLLDYVGPGNFVSLRADETWNDQNYRTDAINSTGFAALAGGSREYSGYYNGLSQYTSFWLNDQNPYKASLFNYNGAYTFSPDNADGAYIRLVKYP